MTEKNKKTLDFSDMKGKYVLSTNELHYYCMDIRGTYALISVEAIKGMPQGYEVWIVREKKSGFSNKWKCRFPTNEEFGKYGWYYPNLERATTVFEGMCKNES